jgi:two-component system, chemotaxis family, chemotaxis protein CheV
MAKQRGILTESGTNEMELLVFRIGPTPYGINVAKVREIIPRDKCTTIPRSPKEIEGSFKVRDQVLTLVNLGKFFGTESELQSDDQGIIIIVEFNDIHCGVLVDKVERIHRLSWDDIVPPSEYFVDMDVPITGIVNLDEKVVLIIDFETIISKILGTQCISEPKDIDEMNKPNSHKEARLLLVDDSATLRNSLVKRLTQYGFENLTVCTDGLNAWETIDAQRDEPFDLILSDIEMPQMDGLHLTSKIKSDPSLKDIPVVLFSSLITKDNLKKGTAVGANAQVSKPDSDGMIKAIETCLKEKENLVTTCS